MEVSSSLFARPVARRSAPLAKLDPRVKVGLCLPVMFLSFVIHTPAQAILALALVVLLLWLGRLSPRAIILQALPLIVPLVLVSALNLFVTHTGPILWQWGPLFITQGGLDTALSYALKLSLVVLFGAILLATTPPTHLSDAFSSLLSPLKKLGVPADELGLVFSLALRFVPTLGQEVQEVLDAQASRGAYGPKGSLSMRLAALRASVVPVLASALRHASGLSMALESRAWESGAPRTRWRQQKLGPADGAFIVGAALYGTALILLGVG